VSLHADHDDLILANGLHIGQIIEVDHLVPSVPAPVLRGFRVLPGRYPCVQQESGDDDVVKEVVSERPRRPSPTPPLPERRARQASSPASVAHFHRSRSITNLSEVGSPARRRESMLRSLDSPKNLRKISVPSVDGNSSDDDDASSSYSSLSTARRNWDFSGSIKDVRPVAPRRRSNSVKPFLAAHIYTSIYFTKVTRNQANPVKFAVSCRFLQVNPAQKPLHSRTTW
jgi:hypothetical protein